MLAKSLKAFSKIFQTSNVNFANQIRFSTFSPDQEFQQVLDQFNESKVNEFITFKNKVDNILQKSTQDQQILYYEKLIDFYQKSNLKNSTCESIIYQNNAEILTNYINILSLTINQAQQNNLVAELSEFYQNNYSQIQFSNEEEQFEAFYNLSLIFQAFKKDNFSFLIFERIYLETSKKTKQNNHSRYIDILCKRAQLAQMLSKYEEMFQFYDLLFEEITLIEINNNNYKILKQINEFFIRAILLSVQHDKMSRIEQYQELQNTFQSKYNYLESNTEKLINKVKLISEKNENFIQDNQEKLTIFFEKYKNEFSPQIQKILFGQLFNKVVPLNLLEYFYMLVKFETNYKDEIDDIPSILQQSAEDLVEDFQEQIIGNIETLFQIRKLICLLSEEILDIEDEDIKKFQPVCINTWILSLEEKNQMKIKEVCENYQQKYF